MVAPSATLDNTVRDFQKLKTSLHRQMVDVIDFHKAEGLSESELRGQALFHGKARCVSCHSGPAFVDDYMHDLRAERFYAGRPEGPIKTFPLRGIKDSPPYLHDGRCPTLHDAVEFFNIVLQLKLSKQEKEDLVAYLLCL